MSGHSESSLAFGTTRIRYIIERGERKHARVVVTPAAEVFVRVPHRYTDEAAEQLVRTRLPWIVKQQMFFDRYRPREPARSYQGGESVRYLGRQYRLRIDMGEVEVRISGRSLLVRTGNPSERDGVRRLVTGWLRERAQSVVGVRVERCLVAALRHGIQPPKVQFRVMTRRWGSCSARGRVLLNPKLVQAPRDCIDYVILHELCHLKQPHHGPRFYRLLDVILPDWRKRKARLDALALPEW